MRHNIETIRTSAPLRFTARLLNKLPPDLASHPLARALAVVALLFLFLLGINGLGDGFKSLGRGLLESFFAATENPFMGLMVGILATTLVQSSSVTTSLIVALVAAPENPLPLANAVAMIMGANIGTTVTNSIVSLAHMGRREDAAGDADGLSAANSHAALLFSHRFRRNGVRQPHKRLAQSRAAPDQIKYRGDRDVRTRSRHSANRHIWSIHIYRLDATCRSDAPHHALAR
jgi:hypothetical protein